MWHFCILLLSTILERYEVQNSVRPSGDEPRNLFSLFTGRDVSARKNACPVGTRNYRSEAAAASRKICFPFRSIVRRISPSDHHHHHKYTHTHPCRTDKYLSKILRSRDVTLSRALFKCTVTLPSPRLSQPVLLKFLKLCVSIDAGRSSCVYLNF